MESGLCLGAIVMAAEALSFNCRFGDGRPPAAMTDHVTVEAVAQTFINYARANPDKWNLHAYMGISVAIIESFPCPKKG